MEADEAVQSTNDDASQCKSSAVTLKYWKDDFIFAFVRGHERKPPEINRGYYARNEGVSIFFRQFFQTVGSECQIVNIGAGFDTLYWRLKKEKVPFKNFIEIDFPAVTAKKCYAIKKNKILLDFIGSEADIKFSSTEIYSKDYQLISGDLRHLTEIINKLNQSNINYELPTLFISECVLVYIKTSFVTNLLRWIIEQFSVALFVNYEQVNMEDRFGTIMLENLRARGCPLSGVHSCESLDTQKKRFLETNWDGAKAWTMVEIYEAINKLEKQRIEKLELLDEKELLIQLFQHYCICIAWKGNLLENIKLQ